MTKRRVVALFIVPLSLTCTASVLTGVTTSNPGVRIASLVIAVLAAALVVAGAVFIVRSSPRP